MTPLKRILSTASMLLLLCSSGATLAAKKVQALTCPDESVRPKLDCSSDVGLQKRVKSANVKLAHFQLGLGGRYEEEASGTITDSTYQFALQLERLCKEYNSCIITPDAYRAGSVQIRKVLQSHLTMMAGYAEGHQLGGKLWANATQQPLNQLISMDYRVEALRPSTGARIVHQSGTALQTGDRVSFHVTLNQQAHLYFLLLSSQGDAVGLFPDPRTGRMNPLPAGTTVRIPAGTGAFVLDSTPGTETLHLIATKQPLADLQERLRALGSDEKVDGVEVLQVIGTHLCSGGMDTRGMSLDSSSVQCGQWQTRGMPLDAAGDGQVVTAVPGDDVVMIQHTIIHN